MSGERSDTEGLKLQEYHNRNAAVLFEIGKERERQCEKWGPQTHTVDRWLVILGEEFGEACMAAFKGDWPAFKKEMVQVAAVAVAIITGLD